MKMLTLVKKDGEKTVFPGGEIEPNGINECPTEMVVIAYFPANRRRSSTYICPWADVKEITIE